MRKRKHCGVEQMVACLAHNQEVGRSNRPPATKAGSISARSPRAGSEGSWVGFPVILSGRIERLVTLLRQMVRAAPLVRDTAESEVLGALGHWSNW